MKLKHAGLAVGDLKGAMLRMLAGEVFYCDGCAIYFELDPEKPLEPEQLPPFWGFLGKSLNSFETWEVETHWYDSLSTNPRLCRVKNRDDEREQVALIVEFQGPGAEKPFRGEYRYYRYARPLLPSSSSREIMRLFRIKLLET